MYLAGMSFSTGRNLRGPGSQGHRLTQEAAWKELGKALDAFELVREKEHRRWRENAQRVERRCIEGGERVQRRRFGKSALFKGDTSSPFKCLHPSQARTPTPRHSLPDKLPVRVILLAKADGGVHAKVLGEKGGGGQPHPAHT